MVEKFIIDEDGQGLIEYLLIISLVALVVIVALTIFGITLTNNYNRTVNKLSTVL